MNNTNPIESITAWTTGVGHGPESAQLYTALVAEEVSEMCQTLRHEEEAVDLRLEDLFESADLAARRLREAPGGLLVHDRAALLDAALDTAWVALCLARALTGDRLPEAWAELHRSNVTDKQRDGKFVKDASGKVVKPATWREPDFAQFLLPAVESEGGEAD